KGARAYSHHDSFSVEDAIEMIQSAGGMAFLAHPGSLKLEEEALERYLTKLKNAGLDGIEVYSSSHSFKFIELLRGLSTSLNLQQSGGSDFHGANKKQVSLGRAYLRKQLPKHWISEAIFQSIEIEIES
ncbi:MAG: hypothetical protein COB67_08995, partial [SAR324 cluster bacterium]